MTKGDHEIVSARFADEHGQKVIATMRDGTTQRRMIDDDIRFGGMTAYQQEGNVVEPYQRPKSSIADVKAELSLRLLAGESLQIAGYTQKIKISATNQDQLALLALNDSAKELVVSGNTAPILPVRDVNSELHMLTPLQMIELATKTKVWVQQLLSKSWELETRIRDGDNIVDVSHWRYWKDA